MRRYGERLDRYTPPDDDPFAGLLDDDPSNIGSGDDFGVPLSSAGDGDKEKDAELKMLYAKWVDLHPVTKENLKKFETSGFRLKSRVAGEKEVVELVREAHYTSLTVHELCFSLGK